MARLRRIEYPEAIYHLINRHAFADKDRTADQLQCEMGVPAAWLAKMLEWGGRPPCEPACGDIGEMLTM